MPLALRSLLRTPGFTVVAILTLALGIGTTTTVFTWMQRVLLNPLPGVEDASRIVALETLSPSGDMIDTGYPDFRDFHAGTKTLSGVLVFKERPLNLGEGDRTERVWGQLVSGNFFDVLGVRPQVGRFFDSDDRADDPAAAPVAIISDSLWRRSFQSSASVLGKTVKLNRHEFTIIGVAPAGFLGSLNGLGFDVWVPVMRHADLLGPTKWLEERSWRALHTLGRLAPGATVEAADAELKALAAQLAQANPSTNRNISVAVMPVTKCPHGAHTVLAYPLKLLLGVSGLLLLIVAANLSNLLLVRATARQREMSIRQALGAGWTRLVGQLFTESLLLSAAGAVLGVFAALWLTDALRLFIPDSTLPIALTASLDARVFAAATGLSAGTALVAGLAAALWSARPNLMDALRTGGRSAALTPRAEFFRNGLVIAQVATAFVTLSCTGIAAKSFYEARRARPGFDAHGVMLAAIKLDTSGYSKDDATAFFERLQQRIATLPGVEAAALGENVPLGLSRGSWERVNPQGYVPVAQEDMRVYRNRVSPGYFSTMHIPLLSGRDFTVNDRVGAPLVTVVSESFAKKYFNTAEAVGRTFSIWGGTRKLTVVGVARDIKVHNLRESGMPYFYLPIAQFTSADMGVAVHLRTPAGHDPMALLPALRREVHAMDPNVPIFEALTLEEFTSASRFAERTAASLLGFLSTMALGLTALGLYGVLSFAVAQRTSEIGVRLALGAQSTDIARLILGRGGKLVALGLIVGVVGALGATRLIAAAFYGVNSFEPGPLILVIPPVVLAALAACWLPARRATKVDPVVALRAE